jgi:hypothetical protein
VTDPPIWKFPFTRKNESGFEKVLTAFGNLEIGCILLSRT